MAQTTTSLLAHVNPDSFLSVYQIRFIWVAISNAFNSKASLNCSFHEHHSRYFPFDFIILFKIQNYYFLTILPSFFWSELSTIEQEYEDHIKQREENSKIYLIFNDQLGYGFFLKSSQDTWDRRSHFWIKCSYMEEQDESLTVKLEWTGFVST